MRSNCVIFSPGFSLRLQRLTRRALGLISLSAICLSLQTTPALAATPAAVPSHAVILMYHHIGEDTPPSTSVTPKQLDAHLNYLKEHNYTIWPLSKLVAHWEKQQPIPPKTLVITADDAYLSVYTELFPRLKALNWPMTLFVNSQPIDRGYQAFSSWAQLREMQAAGVEIANHTHTHSRLRQLGQETLPEMQQRIRLEIETTQNRLKQELDPSLIPKLLAYPYGEYDEAAANFIQQLGYVSVAQVSGAVDRFSDRRALARFPMAIRFAELDDFILKVQTQPLPIRNQSPWDPVIQDNPPKLTLRLDRPIKQMNCFNSRGEVLDINWLSETHFSIRAKQPLSPPRDRYACTAPTGHGNWYWFGQPWIIKD